MRSGIRVPFAVLFATALLASFFAGSPYVASAQQKTGTATAPLPFDSAVTVGTLSNGMRYYIRENHKPEKRAELRLVVNAGSILEDDDQRGLAHFLEHMAFKGTTRRSSREIVEEIEAVGGDLNAGTSTETTAYYARVLKDDWRLALDVLSDILIDPVWSERASPFGFAGPKRVNDPGIAFDKLPPIDLVLLSHAHMDHLDLDALWRAYLGDQERGNVPAPRVRRPVRSVSQRRRGEAALPAHNGWRVDLATSLGCRIHAPQACAQGPSRSPAAEGRPSEARRLRRRRCRAG